MLRRRALRADSIKMFVLDEADEMLSRGFKDQIYDIFQLLPPKLQVGVFSATLPPEALEITRKFMNKPVRILVKRDELTLEGIKQFYVNVEVRGEMERREGGGGRERERRIEEGGRKKFGSRKKKNPKTQKNQTTARGVEARHPLRPLRDARDHPVRHLCQHAPQGEIRKREERE